MSSKEPRPSARSRRRTIFVTDHPYCVRRMADGKYVLMNRDYRPLGYRMNECEHPKVGDFDMPSLTPEAATRISVDGEPDTGDIYLYNDACNPMSGRLKDMDAYLQRLNALREVLPPGASATASRAAIGAMARPAARITSRR